jgi:hypothetical protein
MLCKIIEAVPDTVFNAIIEDGFNPLSELLTKPSSKPSGKPSIKPSSTPYLQPLLQPSSEPSIKPSSKPSNEPSSKAPSTKFLEGLASLGSSLDLSLGMLGLSLESPGEQSQSYVWSLGWNNHGSYHKAGKDSNIGSSVAWIVAGFTGFISNGPKGSLE